MPTTNQPSSRTSWIVLSLATLASGAMLAVSACSSEPAKIGDVQVPRAATSESRSNYKLPPFEEETLSNGLRILFVQDEKLPYLTLDLLIKSGSTQEPDDQAGLSSFVAALLDKGTNQRAAPQIAQDLGNLGAEFSAGSAYDYSMANISGLSMHSDQLLSNFVELVTQPSFSDAEIERERKQVLAGIAREVDRPDGFADNAFERELFVGHPYGRPEMGTMSSVQAIKKKNINQYYLRYYRPNNAILAVVGQYTPQFKEKLKAAFASWQQRDVSAVEKPVQDAAKSTSGLKVVVIDKPDLVQAQVRIGQVGIKRTDDRFIALRVANTILGGAFASRLNSRVRKELGLTYNISSFFDARKERGPFMIETFTKNATIGQTVGETLKLLSYFRDKGVTREEVDRVRGYLKGIFPAAIETPEKLAHNLVMLRLYGVPDSFLSNYWRELDRISTSDVNRAVMTTIDPANLTIVVYAPAAQAQAQLKAVLPPNTAIEVKSVKDYR